jgi:CubicO group peptidase (beta-lactamase class C family)
MNTITALPFSTPEAQGIPSSAILAFVNAVEQDPGNIHSYMLLRHGTVVSQGWWDPYEPERQHMLYSLSKSFTSTAVGFAVAEGLLTVDDRVIDYFPDDLPAVVSDNLAAMRMRHLLTMTTGHAEAILIHVRDQPNPNWASVFLSLPIEYEPGTRFLYSGGATYMLSAVVQKLSGETLLDYLTPRLFDPLGIQNPVWETCPRGINTGGWGLSIRTDDVARFGQFCLQRGEWQGEQLLPTDWLEAATSFQVANAGSGAGTAVDDAENDWAQGYGYKFWRCRHNVYRCDGAFGQYCIVMPDQDAVLAITGGVEIMQTVLDQAWAHLLPAMGDNPLPEDGAAQQALSDKIDGLTLPYPQGSVSSPMANQVSGRRYRIEPNGQSIEVVSLTFGGDGVVLAIEKQGQKHRIVAGSNVWLKGDTTLENGVPGAIAAAGAWADDETYCMQVHFIETPYYLTFMCHFSGDSLTLDSSLNVSFGPTERPQLVGRVAHI